MTRKPKPAPPDDPFEDYLLGRIAGIEHLIREFSGDASLSGWKSALLELRHTLKKYREIRNGRGK